MRINKRKSGNGTAARQWLYLYINVPFIFLFKIGISGNYKRRAKQVSQKGFGRTIPVFAVRVPFAFQCEQAMHRFFGLFNIRYGGSKEWYLFPVVPLAILVMVFVWALDWMVVVLGVMIAWWWLQH
ncbi:MAG: GIY-YIG nuclease family protein [Saprospiraceae bacterium]|nr:GIY-YIG nuclease family protein [Saprospiraceae bacterium]